MSFIRKVSRIKGVGENLQGIQKNSRPRQDHINLTMVKNLNLNALRYLMTHVMKYWRLIFPAEGRKLVTKPNFNASNPLPLSDRLISLKSVL